MNSADIALKKIVLDLEAVFPDPAAEAQKKLKEDYERRQGAKVCPECGEAVPALAAVCPGCGADLRAKCDVCSLPLSGEEPICHCEGFETEEQREEFFRTSPRSRQASKPRGGGNHGWLRARRASQGW